MPKLAANVTTMFQELPVGERFAAARACGFTAVEFLSPYDFSPEVIKGCLQDAGLRMLLLNISPGEKGETGTAALPGREAFFRDSFTQSLNYAAALEVPMIHVLAGKSTADQPADTDLFIENIRWAAGLAAAQDININLEPLNTRDVPGYLHTRRAETADLIRRIDSPNVRLQFDFYHQQIMDGDLAAGLTELLEVIGHVQLSSLPGRHEPQYGEVDVHYLLQHLDDIGYAGWVGCEYWPRAGTYEGLSWAAPYGISPP